MDIIQAIILKISYFANLSISIFFFQTFLGVLVWKYTLLPIILKNKNLQTLMLLLTLISLVWYFGLETIFVSLITVTGSVLLGGLILKTKGLILKFTLGFYIIIQSYILLALATNFVFAQLIIIFSLLILNGLYLKKSPLDIKKIRKSVLYGLRSIGIIDYFILTVGFLLSTAPQFHWDAVYANLYNAKWYVLNNSFAFLPESISSLFPQNAIGYYSYFYQMGGIRAFSLAFFLQLFVLIFSLKYLVKKWPKWLQNSIYAFVLTPIVLFQASNGYYDLLIASVLITILLIFNSKQKITTVYLSISFLIGFLAGVKYFPLALILLPQIYFFINKKNLRATIKIWIMGILLVTTPLIIWTARTYVHTNSPTFPFFQKYFPTPQLWPGEDSLENNFMIQTQISMADWFKGGFISYPIQTYFNTDKFIESPQGYTTIVYILMLGVHTLVLGSLLKRRKVNKQAITYLILLVIYISVGIFSRYYRYLWPYQLGLSISALSYLASVSNFKLKPIGANLARIFIIVIIFSSVVDVIRYYRYYPLIPSQFFQADLYKNTKVESSISYINDNAKNGEIVLDASQYLLARLYLKPKTYECNWYWVNGTNEIQNDDFLKFFKYIITANPIDSANNFCTETISDLIAEELLENVYSDETYIVYRVFNK